MDMLATDVDIERARARYRVDGAARDAVAAGDAFSARIREGLVP